MPDIIKNKEGFTLIELLVVVAIIGMLSSIVLSSLNGAREKANIAKVQTDLRQMENAIALLYSDTGLYPGAQTASPCVQNPEIYLNTPQAGLEATDGTFPGWKGPYITKVSLDPWGTYYHYDPDYTCGPTIVGCQGTTAVVRVVQSFGPNKTQNYTAGDDIVSILCR
jgi:general secretion pathway protein G